jgi:hypothetical protein
MATTTNPREVKPGDRIRVRRLATPDPFIRAGDEGTVLDVCRDDHGAPTVLVVVGFASALLPTAGDEFEIVEAATLTLPAGWSR